MRTIRRLLSFTWLSVILVLAQPARAEDPLAGIDEYISQAMAKFEVPGLAIAVVKDGRVVLAKGYGIRELGKPDPVDADTIFAIGSCTKAFTATAIGILVDEGKMKWDDKVIDHFPEFKLYDPYVTREITIRDLLAHRCGVEDRLTVYHHSPHSRSEVLKRFALVRPDYSFRGKFSYSNSMYLAAGETASKVAGMTWDVLVTERLLKPLGMHRSSTNIKALPTIDNVSTPHGKVAGTWAPVPWANIDNCAPAGAINSSVNEMAKWIQLQLQEGVAAEKRLVSSGTIAQMQSAQTVMPIEGVEAKVYSDAHLMSYGLGWILSDYGGRKRVEHAGGVDGMTSCVELLPELKLGIVILTNRESTILPPAITYHIFDRYLGRSPQEWSQKMREIDTFLQDAERAGEKADEEKRVAGTRLTRKLEEYAGEYRDEFHGPFVVVQSDDRLEARFHDFAFDLEHWHYDTFRATDRSKRFPKTLLQFIVAGDGRITGLKGAPVYGVTLEMKRSRPKPTDLELALSDSEIQRIAGSYESKSPPLEITIERVGSKLKLVVGGGSPQDLVAVSPNQLLIGRTAPEGDEEQPRIDFELDGEKKVIRGALKQGALKFELLPKAR